MLVDHACRCDAATIANIRNKTIVRPLPVTLPEDKSLDKVLHSANQPLVPLLCLLFHLSVPSAARDVVCQAVAPAKGTLSYFAACWITITKRRSGGACIDFRSGV